MVDIQFLATETFGLLILPVFIFAARATDVTLGTLRLIFTGRGMKYYSPVLGFFEKLIWLVAIGQIMQNINNIWYYVAYGLGFSMGTFTGIYIESRLALGTMIVRVITKKDATELMGSLKSEGYGVTAIEAHGSNGQVRLLYTIIKRRDLQHVIRIIKRFNPRAFFSIEEVKQAGEGVFPSHKPRYSLDKLRFMNRKG